MATGRVIREEWLDTLTPNDRSALRSRRDLQIINALMGNSRWIKKTLRRATYSIRPRPIHFIEAGAGDGALCRKVSHWLPTASVTGIDLWPRPAHLPGKIGWSQGDLLEKLNNCRGEGLFGVMILHHFTNEEVRRIGEIVVDYRLLCFCEPWRARFPHVLGGLIRPLCGSVTRHDLPASIDAGFVRGELQSLLGLKSWKIEESMDWRGSLRFLAWKE